MGACTVGTAPPPPQMKNIAPPNLPTPMTYDLNSPPPQPFPPPLPRASSQESVGGGGRCVMAESLSMFAAPHSHQLWLGL